MKTDIQIAQEATMLPIKDVAASIGIKEDDLELYGKYKAKISDELINRTKKKILTESSYSLQLLTRLLQGRERQPQASVLERHLDALGRKKALIALREPSLGPCFGIKGRSSRWRIFPGCSDGGFKSSFYRGFSCNYFCK